MSDSLLANVAGTTVAVPYSTSPQITPLIVDQSGVRTLAQGEDVVIPLEERFQSLRRSYLALLSFLTEQGFELPEAVTVAEFDESELGGDPPQI